MLHHLKFPVPAGPVLLQEQPGRSLGPAPHMARTMDTPSPPDTAKHLVREPPLKNKVQNMLKLNEQPLEPISHRESPCNCVYSLCHRFSEGLSKLLPVQMEKNGGENGALGGFRSMVLKIPSQQGRGVAILQTCRCPGSCNTLSCALASSSQYSACGFVIAVIT